MKKLIVFFVAGLTSLTLLASPVPGTAYHQKVSIFKEGPVVTAMVSSYGQSQALVIGYKKSGFLADNNPEKITAVVVKECFFGGGHQSKVSKILLGQEWNGTGYLTHRMDYNTIADEFYLCQGRARISLAFTDGQNWDSKNGANYELINFNQENGIPRYDTQSSGYYNEINERAWQIIIDEMRK